MKSKKVLGIAVLSTLIVSQLSFSDANIDRLLKEAKKDFDFRKCFDFVIDGIKKIPRS